MSTLKMARGAGPWGARRGLPFDDGVYLSVNKVSVHLGDSSQLLFGIKFEYTKLNGEVVSTQIYGEKTGDTVKEISLDGIDEYLTGVSGFHGPVEGYDGREAITSITFHTNKKIYGPFGKGSGEGFVHFTSISSPGKLVGFHGRHGEFLYAIGVHTKYFNMIM